MIARPGAGGVQSRVMRTLRWVWLGLGGAAAGACLPTTSHQSETAAQCGPGGACEPGGACSFPAADCPGGRRYGEGTGPLAGQCVADGGADAADPDGPPVVDAALDAAPLVPWSDGHHGDLTIGIAQARLNSYGIVVVDAAAGATTLTVLRTSGANVGAWNDDFVAGDRIVVWRTTGLADLPSGGTSPVMVDGEVGRWFATRVTAVGGGQLQLAAPLPFAVPALGSLVVKVPDLATLTVPAGRTVLAEDWRGSWGGVVVVAAEALVLDGRLAADGAGLRGGQAEDFGNFTDCVAPSTAARRAAAAREGREPVPSRYGSNGPAAGRGNLLRRRRRQLPQRGRRRRRRRRRRGAGGHDLGGAPGAEASVAPPSRRSDTHLVAGGGGATARGEANGRGQPRPAAAQLGDAARMTRWRRAQRMADTARGGGERRPAAPTAARASATARRRRRRRRRHDLASQAERVEGCAAAPTASGAATRPPTHPGAARRRRRRHGIVILTGAVSGSVADDAGGRRTARARRVGARPARQGARRSSASLNPPAPAPPACAAPRAAAWPSRRARRGSPRFAAASR
ncbi:MAG: hypothetical protein HS111_13085 [Kofleriaceae bacterium]|nr:hypothetical protein [Kofleriaceae bacterium]